MAETPYHNPFKMRRPEDMPGAAKSDKGSTRPSDQEQGGQGDEGDGNRHHEIHEHEDGTAHSVHTNADGTTEEKDHDSYEEACADCGGGGSEEDAGEDNGSGGPMNRGDGSDMAGMYEKAGRDRN